MSEMSQAQKNKERYRLEGALGYALRIAKKVQDKEVKSLEELEQIIGEDWKGISAGLAFHCCEDLKNAGFAVGLFDDRLTRTAEPQQNKN